MSRQHEVTVEFEGKANEAVLKEIRPDIEENDHVRVICGGKDALNPVLNLLAEKCKRDNDHTPGIVRSNEEQYAFIWQQCTERQTQVPRQALSAIIKSDAPLTYDELQDAIEEDLSRVRLQTHIGKLVDKGILTRTGRPVEVDFASDDTEELSRYIVDIAQRHV